MKNVVKKTTPIFLLAARFLAVNLFTVYDWLKIGIAVEWFSVIFCYILVGFIYNMLIEPFFPVPFAVEET